MGEVVNLSMEMTKAVMMKRKMTRKKTTRKSKMMANAMISVTAWLIHMVIHALNTGTSLIGVNWNTQTLTLFQRNCAAPAEVVKETTETMMMALSQTKMKTT